MQKECSRPCCVVVAQMPPLLQREAEVEFAALTWVLRSLQHAAEQVVWADPEDGAGRFQPGSQAGAQHRLSGCVLMPTFKKLCFCRLYQCPLADGIRLFLRIQASAPPTDTRSVVSAAARWCEPGVQQVVM